MNGVIPPTTIRQLEARLGETSRELGIPVDRVRRMLCTLVVSQMLPNAVAIKGGMGIKLRFGERGTRATSDLDVSTRERGEIFEDEFAARLARGWGMVPASRSALRKDPLAPGRVAFTATLKKKNTHDPGLVEPQYVVYPYKVSLSFVGKSWAALEVEVSDPEVEPNEHTKIGIDSGLRELNERFGFGLLEPVRIVGLEYQIAQKLHAVTDLSYERPHDLVDLQLLWGAGPDLIMLREACIRTFAFRSAQTWPPIPLRDMSGWQEAYTNARAETERAGYSTILGSVNEARTWLTNIIMLINSAH